MSLMTYPLNDIDYEAEDAELFHCTRTSGVWAEDSFSISVSGNDNSVTVGTGLAWINNDKFSGKVTALKEPEVIDMGLPDSVFPRVDVVLLRFDANANRVDIAVKTGTPASSPNMPSIERSGAIYELYLAKVMRRTGASSILASDVTDLRFDDEVCGLMADSVTKIDTEAIEAQVVGLIGELQQELEAVKEGTGILLRSDVVDSLISHSTDLPLSAKQGANLNNEITQLENNLSKEIITFRVYLTDTSTISYQNCYYIPLENKVHIEIVISDNNSIHYDSFICSADVRYRPTTARNLGAILKTSSEVLVGSAFVSGDQNNDKTWIKSNLGSTAIKSAYIFGEYELN